MPADAKVGEFGRFAGYCSIYWITEEGPVEIPKGTVIGKKWKILRKLGEGGCGAVYLVRYPFSLRLRCQNKPSYRLAYGNHCLSYLQVENLESKKQAALKAESNFVEGGSVLKIEVDVSDGCLIFDLWSLSDSRSSEGSQARRWAHSFWEEGQVPVHGYESAGRIT